MADTSVTGQREARTAGTGWYVIVAGLADRRERLGGRGCVRKGELGVACGRGSGELERAARCGNVLPLREDCRGGRLSALLQGMA